jgi:hypothetical protein
MTHPVIKAARAAGAELTSESAQKFFRDVALQHIGLFIYYLFKSAPFAIRAGRRLRSRLKPEDEILILLIQGMLVENIPWKKSQSLTELDFDRFKTSPSGAGLLSAAPEVEQQAFATLAPVVIKTNEQKLQGFINQSIRGIYERNFQDHQENVSGCSESDRQMGDQHNLELVQETTDRAIGEVLTVKTTAGSTRKTGAASGNRAKSVDKQDSKSRVPRQKRTVSGE